MIRTSCHYTDEYIMEKPIKWVRNTYELCVRSQYDNNLHLAHMVLGLYAAGMSKEVEPPKTFGQMLKSIKTKQEQDETGWVADNDALAGVGLKVATKRRRKKPKKKKPKKSTGKDIPPSHPPSEKAKQQKSQPS